MMNTSNGPVGVDPAPHKHVNTSRILEEDLQYVDEPPEIVHVLSGAGYVAVFEDTRKTLSSGSSTTRVRSLGPH